MPITTFALLALCAAAPGGHAALHPAGAVLYLEVPDLPAARGAWRETALARLLADDGVHAALGAALGGEAYDPREALAGLLATPLAGTAAAPTLAELVDGIVAGSCSVHAAEGAVARFAAEVERGGDPDALLFEHFGFQLAFELDTAETATRAYAALGERLQSTIADGLGRDVLALKSGAEAPVLLLQRESGGEPLRIVAHGRHIVALAGRLAPDALASRLAGAGLSLAGHPGLTAGSQHFGAGGVVALEGFATLGGDLLALVEAPTVAPILDVLEALAGPPVTMLARGGHWRVSIRDGRFVTEGFHPPAAGDPLDGAFGNRPLAEADFGLVHPEALCGWLASVDLPRISAALAAIGGAEVEEALVAFDEEHGFRPDRDIIAPLGSAFACNLPVLRSLMSAPNVQLAFRLDDRDVFVRGMDGLTQALLGEGLTAEAADYKGARLYTYSLKGLGGGAQGLPFDPSAVVRPTVVVLADRVFLTTLPNHGKREVRRLAKSDAGAHPTVTPGAVPAGATELVFADWATFFGKVYTSARAMAPMLAMGGDDLPFDPNALPAAEVFTAFFAPSLAYELRVEGGVLHHCESSFGPDLPLALVGAGWLAWTGLAPRRAGGGEVEVVPAPEGPEVEEEPGRVEREARAATRDDLARLKVALRVYHFDQDAYPAALADLEQGTAAFPGGFLDGGSLPRDGWGRDFGYAREEGGYRLWSVGPDGLDQGGAGDDVRAD